MQRFTSRPTLRPGNGQPLPASSQLSQSEFVRGTMDARKLSAFILGAQQIHSLNLILSGSQWWRGQVGCVRSPVTRALAAGVIPEHCIVLTLVHDDVTLTYPVPLKT
jgi:hypothetical protein